MNGLKAFLGFGFTMLISMYSLGQPPHLLQVFNTSNSPLPEDNIRALTIAPDSTLWIGTENGLATLKNGIWGTISTFNTYQIRAIAFDSSGYAWVGTFLNGLWVQTDTGWINHTTINSTLPDNFVRTISFCPNGDAWIGTVAGAAKISNNTWTVYRQSNTNWYTEHVAASYCSPANEVWLGGINSGLMKQQGPSWFIYRTMATGLPDNTILDIKQTANGALWLAMPAAGTAAFDGNLGWVYYNTLTSFNPSNSINHIAIGNSGNMYFASADKGLVVYAGGLAWFHLSSTVRPDTSGTFLPTDELLTLVQDHDGNIWASASNMGLLRIQFLDSTTAAPSINLLATTLLYPNPAADVAVIESTISDLTITLTNIAGQAVFTAIATSPQTKIPLSHLPRGIYMVVLQSHQAREVRRLVVY